MIRQRYPADDPRVAEFAIELARARGDDRAKWFGSRWRQWPWLIWSGPVPDEGDEEAAANTLVQTWWWLFRAESEVTEIADEEFALYLLTWLIGHEMTHQVELMPPARAAELAEKFVSFIPEPRRWFGNNWEGPTGPDRPVSSSNCFTWRTLEGGVIAVAEGRAWIAYFTDED